MAIDIKFDLAGNPEPPTILLATRNGNKLGQLNIDVDSINLSDKFNDASEFTFTLNKYIDGKINNLWDSVVDLKLVYCKEWDTWFEITVELDEQIETVKTVFCTQLGRAELSQIMLYDIEINTEKDIEREDYKISILYNADDPEASILDRILSKAPHYSIAHVDPTIAKIQRSFSFDDSSICDSLEDVGEEIGCLFVYPSNSGEHGKIKRTVSAYDLQQNCNDCGHRGEFVDVCPKCGSTNIKYGYGENTLIFITSDELASEGIQLSADVDSVKNCFKLEAGDDLMTATVRSCNPNGTDYIWRISEDIKKDMSHELVEKLESYDKLYRYYYNEHISDLSIPVPPYDICLADETDTLLTDEQDNLLAYERIKEASDNLLSEYNALVSKYSEDFDELETISSPVKGYSSLMNAYYNTIDMELFLRSILTPFYDCYLIDELGARLIDESDKFLVYKSTKINKTSSIEQAALLTANALSPVAVANIKSVSLATLNSTVLSMAKIIVKPTYKVEINTSNMINDGTIIAWNGSFKITNYSDEEDTAISETITILVNDNYELFIEQKVKKVLNKEDTEDLSITGLFAEEYSDFCDTLKYYALNPLVSFRDACQACIDILIEQGIGNNATWGDENSGNSNLYENLYIPYYNKLTAIESEIKIRENEINFVLGMYDANGVLLSEGMKSRIEKYINDIHEILNFENYLGKDLWLEFCAYRREDKYSNDNYVSDGLNNAELFDRAREFFEVAENEIYKSSELQYSISTTLNNLLAIPKFKTFVKSFKVGNWIRVQVDDKIYRLRLLEYEIDYGDFNNISVEFSDVTKVKNGVTDIKSVLSQASSMASSYGSIKRQASQGEKSSAVLSSWSNNGLNATNTKIVSTDNQNQVWDKNGILCRQYDPITETYSDEQLKIINSTIAITDNNWETTKTAIGKYYYTDPITKELKSAYGVNGETVVGKLLVGEQLDISNDNGNLQFGADGFVIKNDVNTISMNPNDESIFNIKNNSQNIFTLNESGELVIVGNITASSLTLLNGTTIETGNITGLSDVAISGDYQDLSNIPTKLSDFTNDNQFITKDVDNLDYYYKKTEADKLLGSKVNADSLATVSTSGSYNDLVDIEELKNWVLTQIQSAMN